MAKTYSKKLKTTTDLVRITTYLKPELLNKLKNLSTATGVPLFEIVGDAIEAWLEQVGGEQ